MAEVLEDHDTIVDSDRNIDATSFQCHQFEIFKHDYREYSDSTCKHGDATHEDCDGSKTNAKFKKELVNITRKLQRAIIYLQNLPKTSVLDDLLGELQSINIRIRDAILRESSEFSLTSISLPDFDETDMQLFLNDPTITQKAMLDLVEEDKIKSKADLETMIFKAGVLIQEVDHIKNGIRA